MEARLDWKPNGHTALGLGIEPGLSGPQRGASTTMLYTCYLYYKFLNIHFELQHELFDNVTNLQTIVIDKSSCHHHVIRCIPVFNTYHYEFPVLTRKPFIIQHKQVQPNNTENSIPSSCRHETNIHPIDMYG